MTQSGVMTKDEGRETAVTILSRVYVLIEWILEDRTVFITWKTEEKLSSLHFIFEWLSCPIALFSHYISFV